MEPTSAEVIALAVVLPILAIIALALRIVVKRKINQFGIDDCLILCSMVIPPPCSSTIKLIAIIVLSPHYCHLRH
jgi:hypothetical protein